MRDCTFPFSTLVEFMDNTHPFLDPAFTPPWSRLTADHVVPDLRHAISLAKDKLAAIENLPDEKASLENTFFALEKATESVSEAWSKVSHLDAVNDHPELRKAHRDILPEVTAFFSAIPLNPKLYGKLKAASERVDTAALTPVRKRFIEETLKDFEDAGASLDDPTRQRLQEIEARLAETTKAFSEHVLDSTNAFERLVTDKKELAGLPESLIEAARANALEKGYGTEDAPQYRFTLHAPSFVPAMRFLDSDALRRDLYQAFTRIAHEGDFENEPLIREILTLRQEKAKLLGRELFSDWVLSRRMAKTSEQALAFVEDLYAKTKPAFDRKNEELMRFKAEQTGQPVSPLAPWETAYWSEKLRQATYDFEEEALRPYFPVESVMTGLFDLTESLFGIRVKQITDPAPDTWHPSVTFYRIEDAADGRHLGSFYADWFPRESKRSGAWMAPLRSGGLDPSGQPEPHLGFIAGNMSPPVGGKPALLTHDEVETVFHEFGHLLHHILSEVEIKSLSGTSVAWDFVELPSQIMENWCWERESLDLFARHYETGETIPEELFAKLKASRTFSAARLQMRQLFFGKLDLALHMRFDPQADVDLDAFIESETEGYVPPSTEKPPSIVRSFQHLFSDGTGYASGYYSYKWAEVLDADAFSRFAAEGILKPETGKAFRSTILARGNSEEPEALFRAFMGRDPDPEALLVRLGLKASA